MAGRATQPQRVTELPMAYVVLYDYAYEGDVPVGVCLTREAAEAMKARHVRLLGDEPSVCSIDVRIAETVLDRGDAMAQDGTVGPRRRLSDG